MPLNKDVKNIVIWGATGQAKVLKDCLFHTEHHIVALIDKNRDLHSPFPNIPLLHSKEELETWLKNQPSDQSLGFLVAIGGDKGKDRVETSNYLKSKGFVAIQAIHKTANIASDVELGEGAQILAHSHIGTGSRIGEQCIVNNSVNIDHDCIVGKGVHFAPGSCLAGEIKVEDYATIYTGAIIGPRVVIGEGAIIGAGAVVLQDIPAHSVAVGNPAKIIKNSLER